MIIEFFGFPGSGKTTIMNALIKELERRNKSYVRGTLDHYSSTKRIFLKFWWSFLCLFYNPYFYFKNVYYFSKNKSTFKNKLKDFLNLTYLYARYSHFKDSKKLIFFDQGLMQAYWSVITFSGGESEYDSNPVGKKVDKIIVLDLEKNINKERLSLRENGKSRINLINFEDYFIDFDSIREKLYDKFENIVYIDTTEEVHLNVEIILRCIRDIDSRELN